MPRHIKSFKDSLVNDVIDLLFLEASYFSQKLSQLLLALFLVQRGRKVVKSGGGGGGGGQRIPEVKHPCTFHRNVPC